MAQAWRHGDAGEHGRSGKGALLAAAIALAGAAPAGVDPAAGLDDPAGVWRGPPAARPAAHRRPQTAAPPPRPDDAAAQGPPPAPRTDDNSDLAVGGDAARTSQGVTGAGIRIGILSDSFDLLGGYARDVADGDLPEGVRILEEGPPGSADEGRAMAELVHRIAPGAQLLFHTATASESDFAAGIDALVQAGCQIIVDDVSYFDEPFYQDGAPVQLAVEQAIAQGVDYFTAAGNEGTNFYEAAFTPMQSQVPGLPGDWTVQNFGGGGAAAPYVALSLPAGGSCAIDLQWDQPFASIGGGAGSSDSLAMVLCDAAGDVLASAGGLDVHGDPVQVLEATNPGPATVDRLYVVSNSVAAPPDLFKFIVFGNASIDSAQAGIGSGTVTGHEMVPGANTVGAIAWSATPAFLGGDTTESFSSVGPGEILFDAQGNRLATPMAAGKVDFVAPDGSSTSVFDPFYGTSAAAPAAAAVAALMLQANPFLTPVQVSAMLEASAIPVNGPAWGTGAGLIQASQAVTLAAALAPRAGMG